MNKEISNISRQGFIQHLLFWVGVLLYFILSTSMPMSLGQKVITYGSIVFLQIIAAYICIYFLIPRYLNQGKIFTFISLLVLLLIGLFALYITIRMNYLEVRYADYYNKVMEEYVHFSFFERLFNFPVFLSKSIRFLSPTALLLLIRFYKNQQNYLKLNEQKKTAELSALKNQLNPHFLFNTLNNLYALAVKKSDKTPEVISRLSDILDYMLYRCNDKYVSIHKEIELIENYISLEKIRYGNRVNVSFNILGNKNASIAPLLLLTFVENAFKHGVSQEINQAKIDIDLNADSKTIEFKIKNSRPSILPSPEQTKNNIGLKNVRQQLELLYPDAHQLSIDETATSYSVQLNIDTK